MSVFDRFLNSIKLNDDDDLDDDEYFDEEEDNIDDSRPSRRILSRDDEDEPIFDEDQSPIKRQPRSARPSRRSRNSSQSSPFGPSPKVSAFRPRKTAAEDGSDRNNISVCVIRPKSMEDALQIAQMLIAHCTVILNLEGLDLDVSQRIFDFASGACCASRGRLDKISNYIFVLTPHDVEITGEFQQILTGTFDPHLDLDLSEDLQ
ncbi:MAG TPA: cell division protein SepF [Lachnospiraceae bacterium]|jgi:cell division inhibitor SepF|nr:cell division protein SepF [Lachnospiraceae bacterium]